MRLDGLKICVTGGMGYIGSHTVKCLLAAGAEVIVVDRCHIDHNKLENVEYIYCDYADEELWYAFSQHGYVDGIVHCAGTSLVGPSVSDPGTYYDNNTAGTIKMLEEIRRWPKSPFIVFSSSAAVYGNPNNVPIKENSQIVPTHPYGKTKAMIENILYDYDIAYGIKYFAFRYFNASGLNVWDDELGIDPSDTHLIPRIFEAHHTKQPFTLFGVNHSTYDGSCIRDYIHVCDIALANLKACEELNSGHDSRIYNLGSTFGYSNIEILNEFKEQVGEIELHTLPRREGDPAALIADASFFEIEQGLTPQFSNIETIIDSMRGYYAKRYR